MGPSGDPFLIDRRTLRGRSLWRCLRLGLLTATLGAAGLAPAVAAPPPNAVGSAQPAIPAHEAGRVVLLTLVTPSLSAAERFYGGLFNWTFKERPDQAASQAGNGRSAEAFLGTDPVGILFEKPLSDAAHHRPAWLTFFSVANLAAAEKLALGNGAKLLARPTILADAGDIAVFADPQGAVFAMLATKSGDPPDVLADPGAWIWSSLMTTDPDTDAAFYQQVFGDDVYDISTDAREEHLMLAAAGYARATVNPLPVKRPDAHPYWLNYVRVEDAAASAAKAAQLGGQVLVEPRPDRQGGKIAVIADPNGAAVGLMEWQDNDASNTSDPAAPPGPGARALQAPR